MTVIRFKAKEYADTAYVIGVFRRDPVMEQALFNHCKRYFDNHYKGLFFVGDEYKDEIFQESIITLCEKIRSGKIYVEDGILKGKDGAPFSGQLTTYFMKIAKLKYLEWTREKSHFLSDDEEPCRKIGQENDLIETMFYDNDDTVMLQIIADCISHMSNRCGQILTMFYYEEMSLDEIMNVLPSFESKNALKTAKYKCMETLRESATSIYDRYLKA